MLNQLEGVAVCGSVKNHINFSTHKKYYLRNDLRNNFRNFVEQGPAFWGFGALHVQLTSVNRQHGIELQREGFPISAFKRLDLAFSALGRIHGPYVISISRVPLPELLSVHSQEEEAPETRRGCL